jgi:AcrR family transcriptional regulator
MTRQNILEAAAQIFSQKGFHATSMSEIAAAVNLQKASLYHHISSKQDILVSILDDALEIITDQVGSVINRPISSEDKLREAIITYLLILTEQRDLAGVLLLEHRSLTPEFHRQHIPRRDKFEQLWRDLLIEGVNDGNFMVRDVDMTTRAILGIMNWVVTWYKEDGGMTIQNIADQYANLILYGITTDKGS